jgi:YYY domain-containing protein
MNVYLKAKKFAWTNLFREPLFYLAIILFLGGLFRFYNLNWDFKHSFHPDERNILGQAAGIQPSAGYRVQFFAYGQLPVYLYRFTGELVSTPAFILSFFNGNEWLSQYVYWVVLGVLSLFLGYFLSRTQFELYSFGTTALLLVALILYKLYPVFNLWFEALDGVSLKLACLLFMSVISFGIALYCSYFLEIEFVGLPLYVSSATVFLLGIIPAFLTDSFAKLIGALAFTLTVLGLSIWWAWISKWGRTVLGLLAFWSFWAVLNHAGRQYTGYGEIMIIGRWWAALFSTATILAIYLFVCRTYQNRLMALLAAASFAFAVVSIEQAHYCITESFITFMMVVVTYLAFEISQKGNWKNYLLAGAAFGLSMAAKTSSLYYVFIILMGHAVFLSKTPKQEWEKIGKKEKDNADIHAVFSVTLIVLVFTAFAGVGYKLNSVVHDLFSQNMVLANVIWGILFVLLILTGGLLAVWGGLEFKVLRAQILQWYKLIAVGGLAFFIFCLLSPWSLLDFQGFMSSQGYEWHVVSISDACYVIQFKDTLRYVYQLANLISVELWWPLGITVLLGLGFVLIRFGYEVFNPKKSKYLLPVPFVLNKGFTFLLPDLLILSWFIPYFGFIGAWNTKFIRYMVPLIPAFCIFGAEFLTELFKWFKNRVNFEPVLRWTLIFLVVGSSLFYSVAYMHVYRFLHPWIESSIWIFKNIPPGSSILKEAWDDGLPTGVDNSIDPRVQGAMGPQNYKQQDITIYEMHGFPTDDTPIKKNYYANILQQGDYISIASKKLWYTLTACSPEFKPNGYDIYPVTSRYYRLLWSGLLGYKMVGEFHNFPGLFGWEHPDDMAEESFSVYDHPRVYIFKKVEIVPPDRIVKLLSSDDYVKGIDRNLMRTITPQNVDAFIAQRHEYLDKTGLLQKLDEEEPVTVVSASVATESQKFLPPIVATPISVPDNNISAPPTVPKFNDPRTITALELLAKNPVIETSVSQNTISFEDSFLYQARAWFSWLFLLIVLGWVALPLTLRVMPSIASGAYSLSKMFGFLIFSWLIWFFTSIKFCHFTIGFCWLWLLVFVGIAGWVYFWDRNKINTIYFKNKKSWMLQEVVFVAAFFIFTIVRIYNPHIHDPVGEGYNGGGEAGMDFGFLSSIVRGETFPPQNMWMAGKSIGYTFYFGHLMMGVLTKTLGLVPAVTYNLALITLFAAIFSSAFGIAFALSGQLISGWIAGFLCAVAGNLAGAKQYLEELHQCFVTGSLNPLLGHVFDFWGPTRVIPNSINEFPYFSVLFGDMHAHTLAMPFAMLMIGGIASFYLSAASKPFDFKNDWQTILFLAFLIGSIAFLNTWELPTWMVLFLISVLIRNLSVVSGKSIKRGFVLFFGILLCSLTLLGWWGIFAKFGQDNQALGGGTLWLGLFLCLGTLVGLTILFFEKNTQILAKSFISIGLNVFGILAIGILLWSPYFFDGFSPQQNEVLWVPEHLRTHINDFYTIYGLFILVIAFAFVPCYSKVILKWFAGSTRWNGLDNFIEKLFVFFNSTLKSGTAVSGMFSLGLAFLTAIYIASLVHWTGVDSNRWIVQLLATFIAISLIGAVYFVKKIQFWIIGGGLWLIWLTMMILRVLPLSDESSIPLGLSLFSVLWLSGFVYLGLSIKTRSDRAISFSYILVSLFLLILAALEVFVMHEYLGGDYMRNNSLFKFGINAWTLASISVGVFLPQIYSTIKVFLKNVVKESYFARVVLLATSGIIIFSILSFVLDSFSSSFDNLFTHLSNIVLLTGIVSWAWMENWIQKSIIKIFSLIIAGTMLLFPLLAMVMPTNGFASIFQHLGADFSVGILLPLLITILILIVIGLNFEKKKNMGQQVFFYSWVVSLSLLFFMVSVYPVAATFRKCHDFFGFFQRQYIGYEETPTLNGLSYMNRINPNDAAAISFLNKSIPGQPCLLEFVGEGYNSWGSRFSIFTGIPALMGWDGHVKEWIGSQPGAENDIEQRFQATEQIFRTEDPVLAKKYLDAYGVRLVMVGTVERYGVPGRKGGYPQAGLDKFSTFLPLIYKNPEVEIFYNPPTTQN